MAGGREGVVRVDEVDVEVSAPSSQSVPIYRLRSYEMFCQLAVEI